MSTLIALNPTHTFLLPGSFVVSRLTASSSEGPMPAVQRPHADIREHRVAMEAMWKEKRTFEGGGHSRQRRSFYSKGQSRMGTFCSSANKRETLLSTQHFSFRKLNAGHSWLLCGRGRSVGNQHPVVLGSTTHTDPPFSRRDQEHTIDQPPDEIPG
jgi:hypothetical protein